MTILQEFLLAKDDSSIDIGDIKNLYERVISKDESSVFENNSLQNLSLLVEESKIEMRVKWSEIYKLTLYELKKKRKKVTKGIASNLYP